ncbi:MAG TPA: hypothetical protein VKO18_09990 [Terriglobia bacterium]|nr:hypothetical protein [Terriglobia bacterium]
MRYISFKATGISTPDTAHRLELKPAFNHWVEPTKPASILHVGFYHDTISHNGGFQVFYDEPFEEYLAVDQKCTEWELATVWTGALVGSWALVIGCVLIARALLP